MSLRQRIEDALLAQFADNERLLEAARRGELDPAAIATYEARRSVLKPIVTDIVIERDKAPAAENRLAAAMALTTPVRGRLVPDV